MTITAQSDQAYATEDAAVTQSTGSVSTNDSSPEGVLTVLAVNGGAGNFGQVLTGKYGSVRINADGSYTYTLNNSDPDTQTLGAFKTGFDSFIYTVRNSIGEHALATLTVSVNGTHDAPTANSDSVATNARSVGTASDNLRNNDTNYFDDKIVFRASILPDAINYVI